MLGMSWKFKQHYSILHNNFYKLAYFTLILLGMKKLNFRKVECHWIAWMEGVQPINSSVSLLPTAAVQPLSVKPPFLTSWDYLSWCCSFSGPFQMFKSLLLWFSKAQLNLNQLRISLPNKSFSLPKLRLNPGSGKYSREQNAVWFVVLALVLPLS